ncbi:MAG: sulfite exporter TauE/SafE family protein [Candidatus Eremiobacteraeota bacterium]|nr:sulfite exporter TauE/SafE family protein [Candidatus Eremiobacteraeota bacterium]
MNWEYILVGFIVGMCIAYSGVGAGALTTPLLVLFLGVGTDVAIGSDLLFALGTKLVAMIAHVQRRNVQLSVLWRLSVGGLPGAIVGVSVSAHLHRVLDIHQLEHTLRIAVAAALLLSAAVIAFNRRLAADRAQVTPDRLPTLPIAAVGFFVGLTVSITSIGAGSLTLPLLLLLVSSIALRRLVGTDVAFAIVVLVPSLIGHFTIGDVNVKLAGTLLIGSVPGVFVGSHLVTRLPERWFRGALAGVLVVVALFLLPIHLLPHS